MSVVPETYVNAKRALYATVGSGGGGGTPTDLQSPATVLADATLGDSELTLEAQGVGVAVLAVASTAGKDAKLILAQGTDSFDVGQFGNDGFFYISQSGAAAGAEAFTYDPVEHQVVIGDGGATGTALIQNRLGISDPAAGANKLLLIPATANTSAVVQSVASAGYIALGSSAANPAGLIVSDIARTGVTNYVQVSGPPSGNTSLFLRGGQSEGAACAVAADAGSGGTLWLGSSSTPTAPGAQGIVLTDTATTINQLGGAPQVLAASGNLSPGNVTPTTAVFPGPTSEGLWCIMVGSTPVSTQNSRDAQLSTMAYINSAGRCQIGGNGTTVVGSGGSLDIYPLDGTSNFFLTYNGAQQLNNISVVAFKISGPIPGTF